MIDAKILDGLYVSEDGNWGGGSIIVIPHDSLTDDQMDTLDILGDNDKYDYVYAIAKGLSTEKWDEDATDQYNGTKL
jgi:hypothetical protein